MSLSAYRSVKVIVHTAWKRHRVWPWTLLVLLVLTLACGPTPIPTPTLEPEPVIAWIAPDGSGDYVSLEAAVESVPPGATLVLEAGTHSLVEPLTINNPIRLEGAGKELTSIVSEAEGYVLHLNGEGPFIVQGITFRHEGQAAADVVVVQGGVVTFSGCRFMGAVQTPDEEARAGLRLLQHTTGLVQDSEATGNSSIGIWLADQAQLTLERNSFLNNQMIGIAYQDSAGGTARQNLSSGGQVAGFQITDQAQPILEDNGCTNNGSGIIYRDEAGGVARRNECSENDFVGISVGNKANPLLEENICKNNQYGIVLAGSGGGTARGNEASGNLVGLLIDQEANPELEDNMVYDNEEEDVRDLRP